MCFEGIHMLRFSPILSSKTPLTWVCVVLCMLWSTLEPIPFLSISLVFPCQSVSCSKLVWNCLTLLHRQCIILPQLKFKKGISLLPWGVSGILFHWLQSEVGSRGRGRLCSFSTGPEHGGEHCLHPHSGYGETRRTARDLREVVWGPAQYADNCTRHIQQALRPLPLTTMKFNELPLCTYSVHCQK